MLVGGFNHVEKYEFVSWNDYSQDMESHKIPWFQTTNQLWFEVKDPLGTRDRDRNNMIILMWKDGTQNYQNSILLWAILIHKQCGLIPTGQNQHWTVDDVILMHPEAISNPYRQLLGT